MHGPSTSSSPKASCCPRTGRCSRQLRLSRQGRTSSDRFSASRSTEGTIDFFPEGKMTSLAFAFLALISMPLSTGVYAQQTVREGVYTENQAKRGQAIYVEKC